MTFHIGYPNLENLVEEQGYVGPIYAHFVILTEKDAVGTPTTRLVFRVQIIRDPNQVHYCHIPLGAYTPIATKKSKAAIHTRAMSGNDKIIQWLAERGKEQSVNIINADVAMPPVELLTYIEGHASFLRYQKDTNTYLLESEISGD